MPISMDRQVKRMRDPGPTLPSHCTPSYTSFLPQILFFIIFVHYSRQTHKHCQHLLVVWCACRNCLVIDHVISQLGKLHTKSSDWIPARHGGETRSSTPLVASRCDVIQHARVGIKGRIQEAYSSLSGVNALLIDERDDGAESRRRGWGSVNGTQRSIDGNNVVRSVSGNIRIAADCLGVVVLCCSIAGLVVGEIGLDGRGLVGWQWKDVREAPTAMKNVLDAVSNR